jgi:hypothetical protein
MSTHLRNGRLNVECISGLSFCAVLSFAIQIIGTYEEQIMDPILKHITI